MSRFFWILILQFSLHACQDILVARLDLDQLQSERLSEIQWDAIDALPNPPGCEEAENSKALSPCFYSFMERSLAADQQLLRRLRSEFGDTMQLNIDVDAGGVVQIRLPLNKSKTHIAAISNPENNASIKDSLHDGLLSDLEALIAQDPWAPGVKRGVPVRVVFDYDLVLRDRN